MYASVDPAISLSTHSLLPMVSLFDHVDHSAPSASKLVDDGEAPNWNDPENPHCFRVISVTPQCQATVITC